MAAVIISHVTLVYTGQAGLRKLKPLGGSLITSRFVLVDIELVLNFGLVGRLR